MTLHHLTTPITDGDLVNLKIGDQVLMSGVIYTGRDAAHKRLVDLVHQGQELPFDLTGQVIYYVGPAPAKPGQVIGSAGPTTSYRMDAYAPVLIEQKGLKGMIGKGLRNNEVKEAIKKHKAVYLGATGGAGALLAKCIKSSEVIAYPELGPEAIRKLMVEDLPLTVINDIYGGDLYEEGVKEYHIE
ncbi:MAG: Fe-S-containing hydro-lyase [Dehalobacterium sp.]